MDETLATADEQTAHGRAQAAAGKAMHLAAGEVPFITIAQPEAGVAVITLARPQSRNALSRGMMASLEAALKSLSHETSVRAIVLAAEGPVFCAGHDLKELTAHRADADGGKAFYAETMRACSSLMQTIVTCKLPVIAAVQATATAAGCQLVATCDLAVAATSAKFCTPGVNIGLFCSTPMVALTRNVPRKKAMEMLLLGDMMPAEEAAALGLVNKVVEDGAALDGAIAFARIIASKSPVTVAYGKQAFYTQIEKPLSDAYNYASDIMTQNMMAADAQEGIQAFIDKRDPVWQGC